MSCGRRGELTPPLPALQRALPLPPALGDLRLGLSLRLWGAVTPGEGAGGGEQELFLVLHPPCPCSFSVPSFFFFNSVELTFSPFHYSYWGDIGY